MLSRGNFSGYEIKKEIEDGMFSYFIDASFGSIYPALTQMTAEGLLTAEAQEQTGKPDKKVYAITAEGRRVLQKQLAVKPAKDKFKSEFLFQMLLHDLISHDTVMSAIDKQLADLYEDLERIKECQAENQNEAGEMFVSGYGEAVMSAAAAYLEKRKSELLNKPVAQAAE
jgi:DNA-binding PadR family transcriptional regulator